MKFIAYVSQAIAPFDAEELQHLLERSRARNTADGITGLLIYRYNDEYGRGNFLQFLEGPETRIEEVWERIANDDRHHSVIVVEEGRSEKRMFSDWSMGFRNVEEFDLRDFPGFADMGSDAFWRRAENNALPEALDLLRSFCD
ncbi:BLUF domain-containing protein [Actibacterium sp. MT2.3-13A]|uniref:BLUF domain-containing protein n=1 Tax=Actibacterium sp. MT2.3-13A TaxID=2828332 RepID=UPI001BA6FE42|nr:BLUF domain-containing protein [Actibacterium sp. MT2.3-13A]